MGRRSATIILCLLTVALVQAHPDKNLPRLSADKCNENTPIESWHIHVLYWNDLTNHRKGSLALRNKAIAQFNLEHCPEDERTSDKSCFFNVSNPSEEGTPFVTHQWCIYVTLKDMSNILRWFMQNRNGYDFLLHPNSGCVISDHTEWVFWGGNVWPLDITVLKREEPYTPKPSKLAEEISAIDPNLVVASKEEILSSKKAPEIVEQYLKELDD